MSLASYRAAPPRGVVERIGLIRLVVLIYSSGWRRGVEGTIALVAPYVFVRQPLRSLVNLKMCTSMHTCAAVRDRSDCIERARGDCRNLGLQTDFLLGAGQPD